MNESKRGQDESFVLPSEGHVGAFRCSLCGSSSLYVVQVPADVYLICAQCGNHMPIVLKEIVVAAETKPSG